MKRLITSLILASTMTLATAQKWTPQQANEWYAKQPWLVGCNFIPSTAINELEMWQAETWDASTIDRELGWAESIGMNTVRVFLHDLLWQQDPEAFKKRIHEFLALCEKHHIQPMFVLFDSVWDPSPKLGKQKDPTPGVHNSGWVQSPGGAALQDEKQYARLEAYVKGVVGAFANDKRVLCWDVWNEPDNTNANNYAEPKNKFELVTKLLPKAFAWARDAKPSQPLTSGVWQIDYNNFKGLNAIEKLQLDLSDVTSFHNYNDVASFEKSIVFLKKFNRPLICTEWLARGNKSTVESILPYAKKNNVAMYNWGLVKGKTQTNLPWDSWSKPYVNGREPAVWHHEIFYPDGKPYSDAEVKVFREQTGRH